MSARWLVELSCCGRDDGNLLAETWAEADAFREAYTSGEGARPYGRSDLSGHERAGVIRLLPDPGDQEREKD